MNKKIALPIALALALLLLFASCSNAAVSVSPSAASESAAETALENTSEASQKAAGAYPMTFDNYGREVVIPAKPERVLALGPNCSEMLVALGLGDVIIGTSLRNHSRGPLPEYESEFAKLPELNHSSATREAVISSGADFIYGIDWEFGGEGLGTEELLGYGMPAYINSAVTVEAQYKEIRDLGKIFGIEDKAEAFIADQKARIAAVQSAIAGRTAPRVLFIDSFDSGIFTATGAGFADELLKLAGGKNIFGDLTEKAFVTVSYEEALARDPEVIVYFDYDAPPVEDKIAQAKADDVLSQLECVKNERFVVISLESMLAGNRTAYAVETLAKGIYPDLFK